MTIDDDSAPSAPPLDAHASVPVVQATAVPVGGLSSSVSLPHRPPPEVATPSGLVAKSVTTRYADGREVTVTEYSPAGPGEPAASAAPIANTIRPPAAAASTYHAPRRDLGSRPVNVTCPYCTQTSKTRTNHNCGDCTLISVIVLLFFCFPFFWIPFICPSCQDVEHHCGNCGRLVGKSRAECCSG